MGKKKIYIYLNPKTEDCNHYSACWDFGTQREVDDFLRFGLSGVKLESLLKFSKLFSMF